jgi:hypothetical protein
LGLGLLCAGVLACAPGCRVVRYYFPSEEIEIAGGTSDGSGAPAPMNSAATRGLEVRLLVVDDTDWAGPRGLLAYLDDPAQSSADAQSNPIDAKTIARWNDWGYRVLALPIDQVDGFLGGLRPIQPTNVQWLGEFGNWRAVVRAGELKVTRVRVGDGSVKVDPGKPRLIARAWVEPMLTDTDVVPALRLDLGMQIEAIGEQVTRRRNTRLFEIDREHSIAEEGTLIEDLFFSAMLDGSQAIVLMGEAPGVDWHDLADLIVDADLFQEEADDEQPSKSEDSVFGPDGGTSSEQADKADTDQSESTSPARDVDGGRARRGPTVNQPSKPMGQSLGELMLTSPGSRVVRLNQARKIPKRVIVVLIPRVEGGFSLLPRTSSPARGDRP